MSPTAPLSHPGEAPFAPPPDADQTFIRANTEDRPDPLATTPKPPARGITAAEVRPLRHRERHRYSDPCNYLG